jgi:hypothetical protein
MQDLKSIFQWLGLELPRIQTNNIFPVLTYLESNPNSSCADIFANARIKANTAVTNTFGVYIPTAEKLSGATIVDSYALYIANQTSGSSTNYSIYSSGGSNYFGGNTGIGGLQDSTHKLRIQGSSDSGLLITSSTGATRIILTPSGSQHGEMSMYNNSNQATIYLGGAAGSNNYVNLQGGNFGIGTSSPLTKLTINNAVSGAILPYINGTGLSYNNDGISVAGSNTNNTNIGNGITFYNNVASVGAYGPVISWSSMTVGGAYNATYAFITGVYRGAGGDSNWSTGDIIFGTGNAYGASERMRLRADGTLQIGTYSTFTDIQLTTTTTGYSSILFGDGATGTDTYRGYIQYQHNGDYMILATSSVERLRITSEGYLGTTVTGNTVSSGDLLGVLSFVSKDASTYSSGGITNIRSYATSTYNTGNVAGDLRFYVSNGLQNTTASYLFGSEAMRINSDGVVRIFNLTSNGLTGTDSSGNLGIVNSTYTEIATGTITYSMTAGSAWGINNSFPGTIRNYTDEGMVGSASDAYNSNINRGVTFDLGSAKAVRRIVERGYSTKNLDEITVQYSTDNTNWTTIFIYPHVYGNTQKDFNFNPTGTISARYWRWYISGWTSTREVQNYYTYEAIIYT